MKIDEIKALSLQCGVPIIFDDTVTVLIKTLKKYRPKRILEIGGGTGYSGSIILSATTPEKFVTIERDSGRAGILKEVIADRGIVIHDDAYNAMAKLLNDGEEFDFIFVDGPKGQYGKYFNLINKLLSKKGVIFADNMDFHGMVTNKIPTTTGARSIINGLRDFIAKLELYHYDTTHLPDGDGIIIAVRP